MAVPKPGSRNSVQVSHVSVGTQVFELLAAASQGAQHWGPDTPVWTCSSVWTSSLKACLSWSRCYSVRIKESKLKHKLPLLKILSFCSSWIFSVVFKVLHQNIVYLHTWVLGPPWMLSTDNHPRDVQCIEQDSVCHSGAVCKWCQIVLKRRSLIQGQLG